MSKPKSPVPTPRAGATTTFAPFVLEHVGEDGAFTTRLRDVDVDERYPDCRSLEERARLQAAIDLLTGPEVTAALARIYGDPAPVAERPMECDRYYVGITDAEAAVLDARKRS